MDFFAAQHRARRKSFWLAAGFLLAVAGVIVAVYLAVALAALARQRPGDPFTLWDGELFFWTSLGTGGFIALGSLYKIWRISRGGGEMIAAQMGGRMITRGTDELAERRLLNVTEEMAIAAGLPAPVIFVLDGERGLNAFAAGLSAEDSVICVTRGLLEALNRDELQGVVGHEISHIVNGDSRLNLKLIGVLYGIHAVAILGRLFMRARGRRAGGVILFGVLLYTIGFVGWFFGRLLQASVSREREYLADASAAQFTRHPLGLAAALRKLRDRGSGIRHPEAAAASHLFFGAVSPSRVFSASLLATHPPLAERIARLGGGFAPGRPDLEDVSSASLAQAQTLLAGLPENLRRQARQVAGATGLVGGLLLSGQDDIRLRQEELLPPDARPAARELRQWLAAHPESGARRRLVWLNLALPCLREAPADERRRLLGLAEALIRTDGPVRVDEFAFYSLLRGALRPPLHRRTELGRLRPERLDRDIGLLLALLAHAGSGDAETVKAAYQAAMACSPARAPRPFPLKDELSPAAIYQALDRLALTAPLYRKKVLDACAVAVQRDGAVTLAENELLHAYAQSLGCPVPL